ncbi:hypothetical protein [Fodinibius sediminis]|uniref:Uncharacterized protein n=1 Tax=Fodinibius sediminis TaxID=1214077 RepID=A0A521BX72_9BACT|nr:hypothetical protein [Fodinibius sediminis]SMO51783.1 hypothetical protein SAMN06265218_104153 [Fodinibius sediminis]
METVKIVLFIAGVSLLGACSTSKPYTLEAVKTFDPDNRDIPLPAETEEHFRWETFYLSTFYQLEKPLDLGSSFQYLGQLMGTNGRDEAENVNVLDEVPNSSWYTRRHYFQPMSIEALKQGPVKGDKPDTSRAITVIRGKSEGVTPGFTIRDARDNTYIIKLDRNGYPGLMSSSEVIATNIYYASGYFVPQNSITYLDPEQLMIAEDATVVKEGEEQLMTEADLREILKKGYSRSDGKVRVLASKYVEGRPLGPWNFRGRRRDDPNDRIPHEDRREVRGLRVLASWLNDTDRRWANTMAVYVDEGSRQYIRHYLLDMGSTLGTVGTTLRHTKRGQEYRYDPRYMGLLYTSLGLYVKPWAKPEARDRPFYPSVGYFESTLFNPGRWVPNYPNPAFEKVTPRDGLWGAKMVMAFSDEEIRAIVETGALPDPAAEAYLIQTLIERRDKIGCYWYARLNPLDKFEAVLKGGKIFISFTDLGIEGELYEADQTDYAFSVSAEGTEKSIRGSTRRPMITLDPDRWKITQKNFPAVFKLQVYTRRDRSRYPDKEIAVYVILDDSGARVAGLVRED